ncbi:MAG: DUF6377 domain-containing protein [Paludibacteraceae bacterium]|nr:DUF6377 domain-containing protein [Paludibacteraceae bacterium]
MKKLYLLLILLFSIQSFAAVFNIDSLQRALDYTIEHRGDYEKKKIERIASLRGKADYYALFEEYQSYICDSALYYINLDIRDRREAADEMGCAFSMIKKAQVLSVSGLYAEALELLESIDVKALDSEGVIQYYKSYADLYLYLAEYASEEEYNSKYIKLMDTYQDSISMQPADRFLQVTTEASLLLTQKRYGEARAVLESILAETERGSRNYAILTSTLSFVCELIEDYNGQRAYLMMSAISDIEAVVKENKSLRSLAEILYRDGELKKADSYMQISMEDANFYNARLRNVQVSKMLPVISRAYQNVEQRSKRLLVAVVVLLSLFVIGLVCAIIIVRRQHKKLVEANNIKEVYLGKFLELCSIYIDNLENYRKTLNKKVSTGKMEEVVRVLKQNNITADVLSEFYKQFDEAFLNIYPDFIANFNSLMPEGERIMPKERNRLTTELRIYALIRLGITDSGKISEFMHYSITTIYTYRSKIKKKSLYPDDFENRIQKF